MSERHNLLQLNSLQQLHCETGPALAYPDGWAIYALNGVPVRPEYAITPGDQLDPQVILGETDLDIIRELIRKIGAPRVLIFAKEVDRDANYTLVDFSSIFPGW